MPLRTRSRREFPRYRRDNTVFFFRRLLGIFFHAAGSRIFFTPGAKGETGACPLLDDQLPLIRFTNTLVVVSFGALQSRPLRSGPDRQRTRTTVPNYYSSRKI